MCLLKWNSLCARENFTSESNICAKIRILTEILFQFDLIWQKYSKNSRWHFENDIDSFSSDLYILFLISEKMKDRKMSQYQKITKTSCRIILSYYKMLGCMIKKQKFHRKFRESKQHKTSASRKCRILNSQRQRNIFTSYSVILGLIGKIF